MAKSVADTDGENFGGYYHDGNFVKGFSHLHDSGTGGVCKTGLSHKCRLKHDWYI
jgi:putative alpha-1,2-mannosidase